MNIEDRLFCRARLGRHYNEENCKTVLAFFPARYRFDAAREREFIRRHSAIAEYTENLRSLLA